MKVATKRKRSALMVVFAVQPRCPFCECSEYRVRTSGPGPNGTRWQQVDCKLCERRFKISWESF